MSAPKSNNARLRIPKGFYNLMEVFVRALLKNKPRDVFDYGAWFFENLLHIRTITGHDPAIHGAKSDDVFYNIHAKEKDSGKKSKKHKHKHKHSKKSDETGHGDWTDDKTEGAAGGESVV